MRDPPNVLIWSSKHYHKSFLLNFPHRLPPPPPPNSPFPTSPSGATLIYVFFELKSIGDVSSVFLLDCASQGLPKPRFGILVNIKYSRLISILFIFCFLKSTTRPCKRKFFTLRIRFCARPLKKQWGSANYLPYHKYQWQKCVNQYLGGTLSHFGHRLLEGFHILLHTLSHSANLEREMYFTCTTVGKVTTQMSHMK